MTPERRKELIYMYVRTARDTHYRNDLVETARVASVIASAHALDFWLALDIQNMRRIADGSHPGIAKCLENGP